jgi:hypothetical protein
LACFNSAYIEWWLELIYYEIKDSFRTPIIRGENQM